MNKKIANTSLADFHSSYPSLTAGAKLTFDFKIIKKAAAVHIKIHNVQLN